MLLPLLPLAALLSHAGASCPWYWGRDTHRGRHQQASWATRHQLVSGSCTLC